MSKQSKALKMTIWTPPGRISYPYFVKPDEGRQYSDGKFKADLLVPPAEWELKKKDLLNAIMEVGKDKWGSAFNFKTPKTLPIKKMSEDDRITDEWQRTCMLVRAKSQNAPQFIGPVRDEDGKAIMLTEKEIANIKGGDWAKFKITVATYDQQGGGITAFLDVVQFWKSGDAFGQGRSAKLQDVEDFEISLDDVDTGDDSSEENLNF